MKISKFFLFGPFKILFGQPKKSLGFELRNAIYVQNMKSHIGKLGLQHETEK